MKKVIFICTHNSARSQMAEALLKQACGEFFEVQSAGTRPGPLNPLAVEAMEELGIDISQNKTKSIFPFMRGSRAFEKCATRFRRALTHVVRKCAWRTRPEFISHGVA